MYSHYYEPIKTIEDDVWSKICKDAKKMINFYKESGILIESNNPSGVMVSNKKGYININGVNDDSYETFLITKDHSNYFNFCKTNKNNYDIVVVSILLILNHYAKHNFQINSDGNFDDWKDGMTNNAKVLGYAFELPVSMIHENSDIYTKELAIELYGKEVYGAIEKQKSVQEIQEYTKSRLKI